ncbi:MAG: TlpA family protein disulfide reductase [Chitinophagaceae bacterium]
MKKTFLFILALAITAPGWAQHAVVKGTFKKVISNGVNMPVIYFFKGGAGQSVVLSEIPLTKNEYGFKIELSGNDLNTMRYIGFDDELYPLYMHAGEELEIDAANGQAVYSGKLSPENNVFAQWYSMLAPLRYFGYSREGAMQADGRYQVTLDSLLKPSADFIQKIKTGNKDFDVFAKNLLSYGFKYDAMAPFLMAYEPSKRSEYPAYVTNLFNTEKFTDANLWTLPGGFNYIQALAFAKYIIYQSKMGLANEMIIPEIGNENIRAEFIIKVAERGGFTDINKFNEKNAQYMVTAEQKKRMAEIVKRQQLKVPGSDWSDFAYPDMKGKSHHLSDYLGKVVLVDVWATWCKPCIAEQPALKKLVEDFKGKDVVVMSVSIDTEKDKWEKMVEENQLSGLQLYSNNEGPLLKDYEIVAVPRFILFDKKGKVVQFNALRPSDPKLKALIETQLDKKESI